MKLFKKILTCFLYIVTGSQDVYGPVNLNILVSMEAIMDGCEASAVGDISEVSTVSGPQATKPGQATLASATLSPGHQARPPWPWRPTAIK